MILVVMGVCGCGKTTLAEHLAAQLGWLLTEADNHHSAENKRKMGEGIPLTDADRVPWLQSLHQVLITSQNGNSVQ